MARTGDMDIRHERILDILSKESVISVTNLSNILGVAKETVRKDLKILAEQGKVIRIHGGAALLETPFNVPFTVRQNLDEIKKRRVAERASRLIYENESIIIRMPFALSLLSTCAAYSWNFSEIGITRTCSGHSHVGNSPAYFSISHARVLS